jgi:hypothetical protein
LHVVFTAVHPSAPAVQPSSDLTLKGIAALTRTLATKRTMLVIRFQHSPFSISLVNG